MDGKLFANLVLLIIFVYAAMGNLMAWGFNKTNWVPLTKPLLMPVLAIYYVLNAVNIEWILVAALFFAFLGDVFLIWPKKKLFFIGGLVFFLVMQILYIVFIATRQLNSGNFSVAVMAAAIVFLFVGGLVYFKLYKSLNEMKIPVLVYILMLITAGFLCFMYMTGNFNRFSFIQFAGSLFFIGSDTILAFETFKGPLRLANVWIMATYINAQLLLFAGFLNTY
ncbi:MAG TPA: lysoplasmalogenase [Bacteroidales bacterium]|nr:lysoplasmalogenase [Bacteroidales bacterium]